MTSRYLGSGECARGGEAGVSLLRRDRDADMSRPGTARKKRTASRCPWNDRCAICRSQYGKKAARVVEAAAVALTAEPESVELSENTRCIEPGARPCVRDALPASRNSCLPAKRRNHSGYKNK